MGCIVVGVVALRPRKTSSVVFHVKLNRTSRGVSGSRFHRSSHKLERNNRVKLPPPEFSQGLQHNWFWSSSHDSSRSPSDLGWTSTTTQQRDLYTRKSQTTQHNRRDKPASTCERYTHGGVVTAYENEREHSNPSSREPAGGGKVTKLWHRAAAPIPGLGCNYNARTTFTFNGPGPSEFRPRLTLVFSCANCRWRFKFWWGRRRWISATRPWPGRPAK